VSQWDEEEMGMDPEVDRDLWAVERFQGVVDFEKNLDKVGWTGE
jgi:hypothetical protein